MTDPALFFSTDLTAATARFRETATAAGLAVETWTNPHRGPAGEALETLSCEFGPPDAANVLVLNSGVHGTEAFVGAGLILGILQDPQGFLRKAPNTRVVMIHILNPYGAAWGRYVNEDNVDLMKNLTYGDHPAPTDPLFLEFDDAVDVRAIADPQTYAAALGKRQALVDRIGADRLMTALKKGQSERPNSICYNGVSASWSKRTLDAILARYLDRGRQVLFLDLHSGVGGWGETFVMTAGDEASKDLVKSWLGDLAHEVDLPMTPPVYSTLSHLAPQAEFAAAIMEGGTVEFGDAFREAMWLEMHNHLYGDRLSPEAAKVREVFKSFYYPLSDEWRRKFWVNAGEMFDVFLAGLESWNAEKVTA